MTSPQVTALETIRRYCDENLGPSRSSLLSKIAKIADDALAQPAPEAKLREALPSREVMVDAAYKAICRVSKSAGGSTANRYAHAAVDAVRALSLPHGAGEATRVPKVRTSHHRNKEEAARLQALVAKRFAAPSPALSPVTVEVLEALLAFEEASAGQVGYSDCTCMGYSPKAARDYEAGECPHQKARALLASPAPGGETES